VDTPEQGEITQLLLDWRGGDSAAFERLLPLVYAELRKIAGGHMHRERAGHVLQTTALMHEAYIRLVNQTQVEWQSRAHFYAIAAQVMRQILVDYARRQNSEKRGGGKAHVSLDEARTLAFEPSEDILAINEALERLAEWDARKARVVEMRFFGGMSVDETAEVLRVSTNTVVRDWSLARAWLLRELQGSHIGAS
jgi:RNA polymerase sigma factor (TIGR02999 family)